MSSELKFENISIDIEKFARGLETVSRRLYKRSASSDNAAVSRSKTASFATPV